MKIRPFNWVPDNSTVALIAGASPYLQAKANDKVELIWKLSSFYLSTLAERRLKKAGIFFPQPRIFQKLRAYRDIGQQPKYVPLLWVCVRTAFDSHTVHVVLFAFMNMQHQVFLLVRASVRSCEEFQSTSPRCYFHRATLEFSGRCALIVLQGSTFVFPC